MLVLDEKFAKTEQGHNHLPELVVLATSMSRISVSALPSLNVDQQTIPHKVCQNIIIGYDFAV
jgi:hypothetical protein